MFQIPVSRPDEDPTFGVETGRHINKTIYKSVGSDSEYLQGY